MPRVSLLIADDVGLGKTVEAGLILTELLLRRRIRRVLVLTPASLRRQWQEELHAPCARSPATTARAEQREATAATVVGAWLRNFAHDVGEEIEEIERALDALGFSLDDAPVTEQTPLVDARFDTLVALIERLLRAGGEFRDDERLVVFTEYKTTLDYLARRLRERYPADRVLTLFVTGPENGAAAAEEEAREAELLDALATEIDLDDHALRATLESAMAVSGGRPQLRPDAERGFFRVIRPDLPGWREVIDESVRRPAHGGAHGGPMPRLAFSPEPFIERLGQLSVFLPRRNALLMHLAHPLIQRALGVLTRRRYPGGSGEVSRWTVRAGGAPDGADAVVLLSVEELGVNELRETFHRWVRTVPLPVRDGELGEPLPHTPARARRGARATDAPGERERAGELLEEVGADLRRWLNRHTGISPNACGTSSGSTAKRRAPARDDRYRKRQGEVSALIEQSTLARLTREIEQLGIRARQGQLFDEDERLAEIERSLEEKEEELRRRRHHYEATAGSCSANAPASSSISSPRASPLAGNAQAFPVAVEIRLPE